MRAVKFDQANKTYTAPPGTKMYDLPAHCDGRQNIVCFQMSPAELEECAANKGKFWIAILSGENFYPISVQTFSPFPNNADAYHQIPYYHSITDSFVWVWISIDVPAPEHFRGADNRTYKRVRNAHPNQQPRPIGTEKYLERGEFYIRAVRKSDNKELPGYSANDHNAVLCHVSVGSMVIPAEHEQLYALPSECWQDSAPSRTIALPGSEPPAESE